MQKIDLSFYASVVCLFTGICLYVLGLVTMHLWYWFWAVIVMALGKLILVKTYQ